MATDMQSRLAVSIPSMLMTYLTGTGASTTNPDADKLGSAPAVEQQVNTLEPNILISTPSNDNRRPSLLRTPRSAISTAASSPVKSLPNFMYGEAEDMSYASGDLSREGSFMSTTRKSRRRSFKPKTSYSICQPPPKSAARQKIHVRARPLLQLHRLAASARPIPAFELLPSAIFSPSLSRAIAKVFRSKHSLCPADLAIVKADKYHQHEDAGAEEDETRDVLALICKGRKGDHLAPGTAKILLDDGSEWDAHSLPNGGYEFTSMDHHGLTTTARWVVKRPRARRSQSASELDSPQDSSHRKFNFSTISPNSRRHPVIASLSNTTLDINDSYNIPSAVNSALSLSPSSAKASPESNDIPAETPIDTTDILRTLITATAVWVALREGWSSGYRPDDVMTRSLSTKINGSPVRATHDPADANDDPKRSGSIARIFRTASTLKRRSTASAAGDGSSDEIVTSRNSSVHSTRRRARAESTSTVIHRTTWPRPDMRAMRKMTATSTSTHGFGMDTGGEEMTEEDEGDAEDAGALHSPQPKRVSAPTPLVTSATPVRSPVQSRVDSPVAPEKESKRGSSATDITMEKKKIEPVSIENTRRRGRFMRVLMCGMA